MFRHQVYWLTGRVGLFLAQCLETVRGVRWDRSGGAAIDLTKNNKHKYVSYIAEEHLELRDEGIVISE